jgi:hypothetical protein
MISHVLYIIKTTLNIKNYMWKSNKALLDISSPEFKNTLGGLKFFKECIRDISEKKDPKITDTNVSAISNKISEYIFITNSTIDNDTSLPKGYIHAFDIKNIEKYIKDSITTLKFIETNSRETDRLYDKISSSLEKKMNDPSIDKNHIQNSITFIEKLTIWMTRISSKLTKWFSETISNIKPLVPREAKRLNNAIRNGF